MIIIDRILRSEKETWEEAREELRAMGIMLPDYSQTNIEAGRPFTVPLSVGDKGSQYVTVRCEPDAHR